MPRPFFSASSIETMRLCMVSASLRYNDKIQEARLEWSDIEAGAEASNRQRATALGTALHEIAEHFFMGQPFPEYGEPARVFQTAMRYLPSPKEWRGLQIESPIGDPDPELESLTDGEITHSLLLFGIKWVGFVDARGKVCSMRLRLRDALLVLDHKSSVDPEQYAKLDSELQQDLQAALYAYDTLRNMPGDDPSLILYWVYYAKRVKHGGVSCARISRSQALAVIEQASLVAHAFNEIPDTASAPPNFKSCGAFGGCYYRTEHCTHKPRIGQLVQLTTRRLKEEKQKKEKRKERKMALSKNMASRLRALAESEDNAGEGAHAEGEAEAAEATEEEEVEQEADTEAETAVEELPKAPKGSNLLGTRRATAQSSAKPAATTATAAATATVKAAAPEQLLAKVQKAHEARDAARAKLEEAEAKLSALKGQLLEAFA